MYSYFGDTTLPIERPAVQAHSAIDSFLCLKRKQESVLPVHSRIGTMVTAGSRGLGTRFFQAVADAPGPLENLRQRPLNSLPVVTTKPAAPVRLRVSVGT